MRLLRAAALSAELAIFVVLVAIGLACSSGRVERRGTPAEIVHPLPPPVRLVNGDFRYYLTIRVYSERGSDTITFEVPFVEWMRWKERGEVCVAPGFGRPRLFECY